MPRTIEDRVEEEVRKRLTEAASAAGVGRGRISLEVLYLLPPDFVRMYKELFDRALADPVRPSSDGGKDEGRIKARGKSRDEMHVRSSAGAKPGKRYVAAYWPIRSEEALAEKKRLDRSLVRSVTRALANAKKSADDGRGAADGASFMRAAAKSSQPRQCPDCGLIQGPSWVRCPFHT